MKHTAIILTALLLTTGAIADNGTELRQIASKIHNTQGSIASLNKTLKETNALLAQMVKLMAENNGKKKDKDK